LSTCWWHIIRAMIHACVFVIMFFVTSPWLFKIITHNYMMPKMKIEPMPSITIQLPRPYPCDCHFTWGQIMLNPRNINIHICQISNILTILHNYIILYWNQLKMSLISLFFLIHINWIITLDFTVYVGYKIKYNIPFT
jgi:hypothetical protein